MRLTIFLFIVLGITSCYEDIENPIEDNEPVVVVEEVPRRIFETDIQGETADADSKLLSDYTLEINKEKHNIEGDNFFLKTRDIRKIGQLIEVIKDDRLAGLGYHYLLENDVNKVRIQAFDNFQEENFQGGYYSLDQSQNIGFEYDGIFGTAAGSSTAQVTVQSLKITDADVLSGIASSGYLTDGTLVRLYPEMAFLLSFYSDDQRVFSTQEDEISFAAKLSANLSEGQELFVYNREFGYWLQVANLNGENLTGSIDHLVIADYQPATYVEGLVDLDGSPIAYADTRSAEKVETHYYTTEQGRWAQVFSLNEEVNTTVHSPCGDVVHNLSRDFENEQQAPVQLSLDSDLPRVNLGGEILNCNGDVLNQASYQLSYTEQASSLLSFSSQFVSNTILVCEEDFDLAGYDRENNQLGPTINWSTSNTTEINDLSSCDQFEQGYSFLEIRGDKRIYDAFSVETINGGTNINSDDNSFRLKFRGDMRGTYEDQEINLFLDDNNFGPDGYRIACEQSNIGCGINHFEVTHFDTSAEGWVRISFEGEIWMQTIRNPKVGSFPVSGVILIKS